MKILVTGGTGVLGSEIVSRLDKTDHTVRIMSRSSSRLKPNSSLEWAQANLIDGSGLTEAVSKVDTIIHCASSPFRQSRQVDVEGTTRLLEQARAAGVSHFVYISIVGIEKIPYSYYQNKVTAENLIKKSDIPWTILRATQFHNLLDAFLQPVKRLPIWPLPTDLQYQSIDAGEVAGRVVDLALKAPAGGAADIAGPEILNVGEIARVWMHAQGLRRPILHFSLPGKIAAGFRKGDVTAPNRRYGKITWAEWVKARYRSGATSKPDIFLTTKG